MQDSARPYLWMLGAAFSLSAMAAIAKAAKPYCDWRLIGMARAAVMLVLAAALLAQARVRFVFLRPPALWVRSISGSLGLLCTFYAVTHVGVSEALTLMNMYPMWVTLLSWPVLGERPQAKLWAALLVSMGGIACIALARPDFRSEPLGLLAGIGNSIFTAVAMIGLHKSKEVDTRAVVAHFSLVATAVTVAVLFLPGGAPPFQPGPPAWPLTLLIAMGLMGTLGQLAMTRAFASGQPSKVAVVALTQIVFAIGFDAVAFQVRFNLLTLLGIALVAAPTAWLVATRNQAAEA